MLVLIILLLGQLSTVFASVAIEITSSADSVVVTVANSAVVISADVYGAIVAAVRVATATTAVVATTTAVAAASSVAAGSGGFIFAICVAVVGTAAVSVADVSTSVFSVVENATVLIAVDGTAAASVAVVITAAVSVGNAAVLIAVVGTASISVSVVDTASISVVVNISILATTIYVSASTNVFPVVVTIVTCAVAGASENTAVVPIQFRFIFTVTEPITESFNCHKVFDIARFTAHCTSFKLNQTKY